MELLIYNFTSFTMHGCAVLIIVYYLWMFDPSTWKGLAISLLAGYITAMLFYSTGYLEMRQNMSKCYEGTVLKEDHKFVEERCYVKYTGYVEVTDIPKEEIK